MNNLNKLVTELAKDAGLNLDNKEDAKCVKCGEKFVQGVNMNSSSGWKETGITCMCELCFDTIMYFPEDLADDLCEELDVDDSTQSAKWLKKVYFKVFGHEMTEEEMEEAKERSLQYHVLPIGDVE